MRLPLALLLGAAYALHAPPTNELRRRGLYRTKNWYRTDSADGGGSFDRAIDALRAKGDAAAVKALQADVADIVVKIDGHDVDVTEYAREHPGGAAVLRKFHGRDASRAFHAAKHSKAALDRMKALQPDAKAKPVSRASKLFTAEDRSQVHKVLGLWCLGHYVVRIHRGIWSADPTGGLAGLGAVPWLVPHALLSLSSIKFHVPRERIAKKPMIWQEFRMHNIIFALRSFVCAALASFPWNLRKTAAPPGCSLAYSVTSTSSPSIFTTMSSMSACSAFTAAVSPFARSAWMARSEEESTAASESAYFSAVLRSATRLRVGGP